MVIYQSKRTRLDKTLVELLTNSLGDQQAPQVHPVVYETTYYGKDYCQQTNENTGCELNGKTTDCGRASLPHWDSLLKL